MKPVCVPCQRFYWPKKSGYYFVEGKQWGGDEEWDGGRGKDSVGWTGYKVWSGDLYECSGCGSQIVVGVGTNRVAEHHESNFDTVVEQTGARQLLVKDC